MSDVLVTGANGFIGSHLVRHLLQQGDQVSCLIRRGSSRERIRDLPLTIVAGDVTDEASVRQAVVGKNVVYHLAGCLFSADQEGYDLVNAQGSHNVAQACAAQKRPPVLVFVSSLAAAGPSPPGRPRRESDPPSPVSHYGRSKRKGELAVQHWAHQVPATIVRPPAVFGEGDCTGLPMFSNIARFRSFAYTIWPTLALSLIHVDDLASFLILAAQSGSRLPADSAKMPVPERGIYYVADEEPRIGAQWGRAIASSLGCRLLIHLPIPTILLWPLAAVCQISAVVSGRVPYFGWDRARLAAAGRWLCSPKLAADELGFHPAAPLAERFRQTADWYRENGWLRLSKPTSPQKLTSGCVNIER